MTKNWKRGEKNKLSAGAKLEIKAEIGKEAPYVAWSNAITRLSPHQRVQRIALKANRGGRPRHPIGGRWVDGIGLGRRDPRLDWVAIPRWTSAFSRLGRFGSAGSRPRRLVIAPSSAMIAKPIHPSDSWFVNPSPLPLPYTYMIMSVKNWLRLENMFCPKFLIVTTLANLVAVYGPSHLSMRLKLHFLLICRFWA